MEMALAVYSPVLISPFFGGKRGVWAISPGCWALNPHLKMGSQRRLCMSNSHSLKLGSLLSYMQMFLSIVMSLAYTPVMIRLLGQNEYGLYQTVVSTVSMLSILSLGFHSGYIRFFTKYRKRNDQEAIFRLNGLYLCLFSVIGLVAFACGMYLAFHASLLFDKGLTENEYELAKKLLVILSIHLAVYFPASVFETIISAHEKFSWHKAVAIVGTLLNPMIMLPLLLMGFRSVAIVVVTTAVSCLTYLINFCAVRYKLKQKFYFGKVEKGLLKSLVAFTVFIGLDLIITQINREADKILLARYQGTVQVAVYAVGMSMYNYFAEFSASISFVFTPKIHTLYNEFKDDPQRRNEELSGLFINVGRIQFLLLGLVASGVVLWGREFIRYWVGRGYENAYWVALLLVLPSCIELIQSLGIEIQRAMNKHQFRSVAFALMAMANIAMTIFLCQRYGAVGAAVGTAISMILANGIAMNIYYYKQCGINIPRFWKNIGMEARGLVIPVLLAIGMKLLLPVNSIWMLLAQIAVYTLVYAASMWKLGMNDFEKDLVFSVVRKVLPKAEKNGVQ